MRERIGGAGRRGERLRGAGRLGAGAQSGGLRGARLQGGGTQGVSVASLEPDQRALVEGWGVRDFPVLSPRDPLSGSGKSDELCCLPADRLQALFSHKSGGRINLYPLLYNLVWQAYTLILNKRRPPVDGDLRTFWYTDIKTPLSRLGLLDESPAAPETPDPLPFAGDSFPFRDRELVDWRELGLSPAEGTLAHTAGYLSTVISDVFGHFVSNDIFRFRDFGFQDDLAEDRFMATTRPNVIFAAEKTTFKYFAQSMSGEFGFSSQCLRGEPKLLTTEYFTEELSKVTDLGGDFLILGCVDWDPSGETILQQFREQLGIFGLLKTRAVNLITPDILSPDDLEQCKYKIPVRSATVATIVREWIARGGGIDGEAFGLESDMVPKELIRGRIAAALGVSGP